MTHRQLFSCCRFHRGVFSLQAPRLASANKDRGNSEEQNAPQSISNTLGHADSVPPAVDSMWRFDIEPTSTWDAFLHQIQDVTGVVGISGESDGCCTLSFEERGLY